MRILLDTHALYWFIEGGPQLSAPALTAISDPAKDVLLSPASYCGTEREKVTHLGAM